MWDRFLYMTTTYYCSLLAITLPSYRISGYIHAIWPPTGSSPLNATSQPPLLTVKANHVRIKLYRFLPRSSSSSPRNSFRHAGVQSSRRPARARPRPFVYKHPIEPSQQHLDANNNFPQRTTHLLRASAIYQVRVRSSPCIPGIFVVCVLN